MHSRTAQAAAVSDLSPLVGMPLESLDLSGCTRIRDLAPLAKIPTLARLYLHSTTIPNLSGLVGAGLRTLHLERSTVRELSALKDLPLEELALGSTEVADVSPLLACPKLRRVLLPQAASNVEVLREHPAITHLSYGWDAKNGVPIHSRLEMT